MIKDLDKYSDTELKELLWENERTACMTNLHYLATKVLGYEDLGQIHKPLCQVVESINPIFWYLSKNRHYDSLNSVRKAIQTNLNQIRVPEPLKDYYDLSEGSFTRLFLLFRGGFKTTLITISHMIQTMLIWPDIRILVASHKKEDGSEPILRSVKHHFMYNDVFRDLFPEYVPKPNKLGQIDWGTKDAVTLPNRSKQTAKPESTIEVAGMTTNVTGRHYDLIKADDLVTRDSVTNETMIQKTRQQNALLKFLFDQPEWGVMDYIGTPYHFNDLYGELRKSKSLIKIAVPVKFPDGEPTFPERFTKTGIENIRLDGGMTNFDFSCQYLLNPIPAEDQDFRPEWIERLDFYYHKLPSNLKKYIFVDPASRRRKLSDYTAIMVLGIDEHNMIYLVEAIRDKLNPEGRTNLVLQAMMRHQIKVVQYETIGFQDTDVYILKRKAQEIDYGISVKEVKSHTVSKHDRIRGLTPLYERGLIRWPKEFLYYSQYEKKRVDMIQVLKDEMLMYPKVDHDDLLDVHSQFLKVYTSKASKLPQKQPDDQFAWWKNTLKKQTNTKKHFTGLKKRRVSLPAQQSWK